MDVSQKNYLQLVCLKVEKVGSPCSTVLTLKCWQTQLSVIHLYATVYYFIYNSESYNEVLPFIKFASVDVTLPASNKQLLGQGLLWNSAHFNYRHDVAMEIYMKDIWWLCWGMTFQIRKITALAAAVPSQSPMEIARL
jgi:hypothetical protein